MVRINICFLKPNINRKTHILMFPQAPTARPHHRPIPNPTNPLLMNFLGISINMIYSPNQKMDHKYSRPPQPINIIVVDEMQEYEAHDPFDKLRKYSTNLNNQELYEDDQFKMDEDHLPKGICTKRLKDIYPAGHAIAESTVDFPEFQWQEGNCSLLGRPSFISEMRMLPQWHFLTLIEPKTISQQGFYHVAVVQNGRIAKIIIDDFVYYDERREKISAHPFLEEKPWAHIIIKAWAKLNKGYENLDKCQPFQFIKTFSFPDWSIFNPGIESLGSIIGKIGPTNNRDYFYIGKTKSDEAVGQYGLTPNCASYLITGYYQQYGNIFLKIKSMLGDKWNGCSSEKEVQMPTDEIRLAMNQFIIPLKIFINIFHLIYYTTNKFIKKQALHYNKYTISLDARESKASFIRFQVAGQNIAERMVSINFYFPSVKPSDYGNHKESENKTSVPPSCKICIGRSLKKMNLQGSMTYAESLKENILKNQEGYFLNPTNSKYEHVKSDYFQGYANEVTYHLKIKPGQYLIRLKIEKLLPQYRAILNFTSNEDITINQQKMSKKEQTQFFSEVLSDKARKDQLNVIYPFPYKKQSWIMANNDFSSLGYGTIIFQTGKNDNNMMIVNIDTKKLKRGGYRIKNKLEMAVSEYLMRLKEGESIILIVKQDNQFQGQRVWPPQGIYVSYEVLPAKARENN